jgi:PAS domain S-box-containing protein
MTVSARRRTSQRRSVQRMRNTNRLYAVLSHVGEAVVRIANRDHLLTTVCQITVEHGNFPLAWVGLVDSTSGVVTQAATAGPAASYLDGIHISVNAEPEGRGPTGIAISEARTVVNNDLLANPASTPWHAAAQRFGLRASAAFPLSVHGRPIGALNLYAARIGFFDQQEIALLERIADALSFALEKLADDEQRHLATLALQESAIRYRRLADHAPDLIYRYRLHPTPGFEYVSPSATTLTGYSPDDHYADPALGFKLVHPEDRALLAQLGQDPTALATPIELRWIRRDRTLLWVEQRNVPVLDEHGALVAIEGIARDITDRKLFEQALREEQARLEARVIERTLELQAERDRTDAILESLGEAVLVFDHTGALTYTNRAAQQLSGADPTAIGQWWKTQRGETDQLLSELRVAARERRFWQGELLFRRADGSAYDAAVMITPLFAPDNPEQPIGFVSVHRDITAIKAVERMKDQFVSNVSHELRSPTSLITMLAGNLEVLYSRLDDVRRLQLIGEVRKHARHLSDVIGGVLEISRIDSGTLATERALLNLTALVAEELVHLTPVAQRKSLQLVGRLPEKLFTAGHAGQLQQVVRNLLTNAIKYTPDGGRITVEGIAITAGAAVEVAAWPGVVRLPAGEWTAIAVTDTGVGISPSDLPHVFERFFRAETQSRIPGTGLGLAIAAELVRRHGGYLDVRSTLGHGSTFALYLPRIETL